MSPLFRIPAIAAAFLIAVGLAGCDSSPHSPSDSLPTANAFGGSGGALSVTVVRRAPDLAVANREFVWEAKVSGQDASQCSFDWTVTKSGGNGLYLFNQNTLSASHVVPTAGTYTVAATATCGAATGTGSRTESVVASGSTTYPTPPPSSGIPRRSSIPPPSEDPGNGGTSGGWCVMTHIYVYDDPATPENEAGYYRWFSSGCGSGGSYTERVFGQSS